MFEIVNEIIALLAVVVPSLLSLWIWKLKTDNKELMEERRRMKAIRHDIYMELISPYISLFVNISDSDNKSKTIEKLQSEKYANTIYEFCINGSDEAIKALNKMRLYAEKLPKQKNGAEQEKMLIDCWGGLLLALRKDLGERKTKLNKIEILIPHLKELDKYV